MNISDSIFLQSATPLDEKLSNLRIDGSNLIIETVEEYLSRVTLYSRTIGLEVSILSPAGVYPLNDIVNQLKNKTIQIYSFSSGIEDADFTIKNTDVSAHELTYDHSLIATAIQTETDPVFSASDAASITLTDISNWNAKAEVSDIPTSLADLSDDSTHRTVTDTEKSTWNGKQDALGFTPEDVLNKVTSFQVTPDDTHYPSEKLVKDSLDGKQPAGTYSTDIHSNIVALNAVSGINSGDQDLSGLVPYTGATGDVNLGVNSITTESIIFNDNPVVTPATRELYWDATNLTLSYKIPDGGLIQVNQEPFDYYTNLEGGPIVNGDIVSTCGASGNRTAVCLTDATNDTKAVSAFGMVTVASIANNNPGRITKSGGKVRTLNTIAYPEGTILYVDPLNKGKWTATRPQAPNRAIKIGTVSVSHATEGIVELDISIEGKLSELADVDGTPLTTTGQIPVWHNDTTVFDFDYNINNYVLKTALTDTIEVVANKENTTIDTSTTKYPTVNLLKTGLDTKQATLISGTNIKTINSTSLLGAGNIEISGTGTDEKVKYNVNDASAGYLADKIVAGTGISLAEGTGGDADKLVITSTATGGGEIWTALTGTYASAGTFTFAGTDKDAKLIQLSLLTCTDSAGTTRRIGYIKSAVNNSGTITATVVTDSDLASGDKDFKVAYNRKVNDYLHLISIPGECIADTSYSQGVWFQDVQADAYLLPVDTSVLTAAAGTGAALTYNIYKGSTNLFSSAPDMTTNTVLRAQRPTTNTISAGDNVSLRIMSSAGATNKAADFQAKLFIVPQNIWTSF